MIRRARTLMRPEGADPVPRARVREALALWIVGLLWMAVCLVVARLDLPALMPAALVGGLVMTWGGRRLAGHLWFPLAVAAAILIDPLLVVTLGVPVGALTHLDLVLLAVVILVTSRLIPSGHSWVLPTLRRSTPRLVLGAVAVAAPFALAAAEPWAAARAAARCLAVYLVVWTLTGRPERRRGLWGAIALVTFAVTAGIAVAALRGGLPALLAHVQAADRGWAAPRAVLHVLLFAAPVTLGHALDRRERPLRWGLACVGACGLAAAVTLLAAGFPSRESAGMPAAGSLERFVLLTGLLALGAAAALRTLARLPAGRGAWAGLAVGFAALALAGAPDVVFSALPVSVLAAAGAAATVSTLERAGRRRRARTVHGAVGPPLSEAA